VVAALLRRERDPGRAGAFLDVSMFDGVAAFIAPHMLSHLADPDGVAAPGRMHLNGGIPCYHLYRSADDRWMALAALEPKFWVAFCALVERPDLVSRQFEPGDDVVAEVQALIGGKTRAEWMELVEGKDDILLEPVNSLGEAAADPHLRHRGLLADVGAALPQPAPVVRLEDGHRADSRVPGYGEDTDAILAELGYDPAEIEQITS
jgi:crotonobetainyl-CoA:carnitine CoA-transferase CaiB-like acyl-CoA transferase